MIQSQAVTDRGLRRGQEQGRKKSTFLFRRSRETGDMLHGLGGTWGQCHKTLAPASNPPSEAGLRRSFDKPSRTACFSHWVNPYHVVPAAHKTGGCLFTPAVIVNELYPRERKASMSCCHRLLLVSTPGLCLFVQTAGSPIWPLLPANGKMIAKDKRFCACAQRTDQIKQVYLSFCPFWPVKVKVSFLAFKSKICLLVMKITLIIEYPVGNIILLK